MSMSKANQSRSRATAMLRRLNQKFQRTCGFDIVDMEQCTYEEATDKVRKHIKWFRNWAEETAREMELELTREVADEIERREKQKRKLKRQP